MGASAAVHPTDPTLQDYGLGKLDDTSAESVCKHLASCPDCERRVAELSSDEFLGRLQNARVKSDKSAAGWSPFGVSSTESACGAVVPPPPVDTLPPELVDHADYEIVREIGRGGMGVVYLARNKLMGRLEVLKVVGGQLIERPGVRDRFLREVQSAAKLQHRNIVSAYSAVRLGESIVLAMEYIDGEDLAKMVKSRGPLPVVHACYFIYQAALGLQHAHERGMVHRDIKPANLIFATEGKKGVVKVLDFGLAKVTSEGQADSGLTREGQMLGTPDYIAPEQIRDAQSADIRADIYSLGCTFYYLLTGGPPFRGEHLWDLYQAHFSMDASPLNLVRPEVPVELAAVVAKMMAKEPRRRFQTPGEVAQALTPFFKKGSAPVKGATTEISQAGEPEAKQPMRGAVSVPPRPAVERAPAPVSEARKPGPRQQGSILEGLIDLRQTEPLFDTILDTPGPVAVPEASRQTPRPWSTTVEKLSRFGPRVWWAAAGVLLLGLVVASAAVVLRVKTANGTIVLENVPENAVVEVDGDRITVTPTVGEPLKIDAPAGKHGLVVRRGNLVLLVESVTLEAGKPFKHKLTARLEPPVIERPGKIDLSPNTTQRSDPGPPVKTPSSQDSITNSIGMTLKLIPAGEFMMGSPGNDKDAGIEEKPQHRVRISKSFYLGVYEVTQAQFKMENNPSAFSPNGDGKDKVAGQSTDQYPAEGVSWFDAVLFCNKLSAKEGRRPFYEIDDKDVRVPDWNGPGYRLPTEAEWEYACRANASTPTRYSFGDDAAQLGEYGWFQFNSSRPHPVGRKKPNGFGLHDMHGNVSEWCWDWYGEGYYKQSREDDPTGPAPALAPGLWRLIRGGSSDFGPNLVRAASRNWGEPSAPYKNGDGSPVYRDMHVGFRLARDKITARLEPPVVERAGKIDLPPDATQRSDAGPAVKAPSSQDSITNSIGMTLKLIPAGEFMMGSPDNDKDARSEEKPQHRVRISKSFYLGVYEVTQAQYKAVIENNPSALSPNGDGKDKVAGQSTDQYPVAGVSWFDAVTFCNKLSAKEGRRPFYVIDDKDVQVRDWNGPGYRLPTEAEWEYACRANAPTPTRYSFGDDAAQLGEYGWLQFNSSRPHPVGKKKPNGFGLHDMYGNVAEWCWDWYGEGYYKQSREDDPTGPAAGPAADLCRVIRGGGCGVYPQFARSAWRNRVGPAGVYGNGPGEWDLNLGFRLAVGQSER